MNPVERHRALWTEILALTTGEIERQEREGHAHGLTPNDIYEAATILTDGAHV